MANRVALTVDLEPDWGVRGTRALETVTVRFLRFLEERGMRATFFVVSDLMDASRGMVAAVAEANEVASHGRSHRLLDGLTPHEARREMTESRQRLAECGQAVEGFRAPFFRRCAGFLDHLVAAGYRYDASVGTVMPGPLNGRLGRLPCPVRWGGAYEFPTSAMAAGMLPLSLTWLRLCAPLAQKMLPRRASVVYLHLHEFLPPETASCLPALLRPVLTRNSGEAAWDILDRALDALGGECTTCRQVLDESLADGAAQEPGEGQA